MSELYLKLKMLWYIQVNAFDDWRGWVWERDPDGLYCCNGEECGCGGMTNRESWGCVKTTGVNSDE